MKLCLLPLLLFAPLLHAQPQTSQPAPINFQLSSKLETPPEGPERQRTFFTIGDQQMAVRLPQNCAVSSDAQHLTILLSNRGVSGEITITASPLPAALDFTREIERYHQTALATIPGDATDARFLGAKSDVYNHNQRTSLTFEWEYTAFAKRTHRQVAFINLDSQHQICLQVVCDESGWHKANPLVTAFMRSWYLTSDSSTPR